MIYGENLTYMDFIIDTFGFYSFLNGYGASPHNRSEYELNFSMHEKEST